MALKTAYLSSWRPLSGRHAHSFRLIITKFTEHHPGVILSQINKVCENRSNIDDFKNVTLTLQITYVFGLSFFPRDLDLLTLMCWRSRQGTFQAKPGDSTTICSKVINQNVFLTFCDVMTSKINLGTSYNTSARKVTSYNLCGSLVAVNVKLSSLNEFEILFMALRRPISYHGALLNGRHAHSFRLIDTKFEVRASSAILS